MTTPVSAVVSVRDKNTIACEVVDHCEVPLDDYELRRYSGGHRSSYQNFRA